VFSLRSKNKTILGQREEEFSRLNDKFHEISSNFDMLQKEQTLMQNENARLSRVFGEDQKDIHAKYADYERSLRYFLFSS
jgi:hypothetical protein